jgi:homoserine kinase
MSIIVEAPASIANLAVGFDLLGQSFGACHDRVTARKSEQAGVHLGKVSGLCDHLPKEIARNTALRGANALLQAMGNPFGVVLDIEKGIPLSAGMGGSAASSVGAVVAVNYLLETPLPTSELFAFALEGERASSDPAPKDNTAACLFGGLILAEPGQSKRIVRLPAPKGVHSILFHPDLAIETGTSRAALAKTNSLADTIEFAGRIAAFTHACHSDDVALLRDVMQDILIEPQRAASIAPFAMVQRAALQAGAICCSISGSGPSIFAWAKGKDIASVRSAMAQAFATSGTPARGYESPLNVPAAGLAP